MKRIVRLLALIAALGVAPWTGALAADTAALKATPVLLAQAAATTEAPKAEAAAPAAASGKSVVRSGTVNSGPNAGKKIIEYSDGTKEYQ
jgi:hypothetical protein